MKRKFVSTAIAIVLISLIALPSKTALVEQLSTVDTTNSKVQSHSQNSDTNKNMIVNQYLENQSNSFDNRKLIKVNNNNNNNNNNCGNKKTDKKCNQNVNKYNKNALPRFNEIAYQNQIVNQNTKNNDILNETKEESGVVDNGVIEIKNNNTANEKRKLVCALGNAENYLWWLNKDGSLRYNNGIDLSNQKQDENELNSNFNDVWISNQGLSFISLANNKLSAFPKYIFNQISTEVEYISLYGNSFDSVIIDRSNNEMLPLMLNLKHLDMRNCNLKNLHSGVMKIFPNIEYLFLSHNKIQNISNDTFAAQTQLKHLDLSFNNWHVISDYIMSTNSFEIFKSRHVELTIMNAAFVTLQNLETLDLSFSKLNIRGVNSTQNVNRLFGSQLIHLSLCFTMISKINEDMFRDMDNLKILDISGNYGVAHSLTRDTFKHLNNSLEVLYAKYNNIRSFNWTSKLENLKFINLKHNFISRINHESFQFLPNIKIVDLSNNFIINWLTPVFKHNPLLKVLNIRKNYINSFTNDMLKDFSNVDYLTLGNNPLECSCILKEIFDRIDQSGNFIKNDEMAQFFIDDDKIFRPGNVKTIVYKTYFTNELIKSAFKAKRATAESYPERTKEASQIRKRDLWQKYHDSIFFETNLTFNMLDFNDIEYTCLNLTNKAKVKISELQVCTRGYGHIKNNLALKSTEIEVQIMLVACFISVFGFVLMVWLYRKWWYIRYFFIILRNSTVLSFFNDDDKEELKKTRCDNVDFSYDVFISYSDNDRAWVLDELLPQIEGHEGVSVCLHERDFQVGLSILENIINCIDRSRSLLLVISKSFIQSRWCQFEMHMAQHRLLETRRDQLLLVLLEDVNENKSPRTLRYLMKTKTYIKWPSDAKGRQVFWKRLKKSIVLPEWGLNSIKIPVLQ